MTAITIVGRIGQVKLKFTPSGRAVLNGSVAVDREKYNKDTRQYEKVGTDWHRFDLWGAKAEAAAEVLTKGTLVIVTGDLESRDYEAASGAKTVWEIHAREVGVIPMAARSGATPRQTSTPAFEADPWATDGQTTDVAPW